MPIGELAAASCSFLWAACSLAFAFAGRRVGGAAVNQIRIHMALVVLFGLHALVVGSLWPEALSTRQLTGLAVSGLVGLSLGDLFLFVCMAAIGPRFGTLLMATSPLMTVAIEWLFLGEVVTSWALVGIAVTTACVALVLIDPRGADGWRGAGAPRGMPVWPVVAGLLGALGQATGLVLARDALRAVDPGEVDVPTLSAVLVRMTAGAIGVVVIAMATGRMRGTLRALRDRTAMRATAIGVVFGPVLGVWMSQVAIQHAKAGASAALMSLSPVLMVPIARIAYGARPGFLAVLGTLGAVGGSVLIVLAQDAARGVS